MNLNISSYRFFYVVLCVNIYYISNQRAENHSNSGDYSILHRVSDACFNAERSFCSTQSEVIFRNGTVETF